MKKNLTPHKFYNIMATEGETEATILLYSYIGEVRDWYTGEQLGVTDIEFVKELDALAAKYPKINIRINSPGGEVFHGSAMVTAIRNCKAEVHTWIDGVAASMAGIIWMSGHKRHMAKNAMLMLHSASNICWGNAKEMREIADILDKFDQSIIIAAADAVGMDEAMMQEKYFNYTDHWLTYKDVDAEGWLAEPDDYEAAAKLPNDMTSMPYRDLVAYFEAQEIKAEKPGWMAQAKEILDSAKSMIQAFQPQPSSSTINDQDMNLEDFKASITDGKLNLDEVKAHIASLMPPAAPVATAALAEEAEESAAIKALRAEIEAGKEKMTALENRLTAFGALPGASRSTPGLPDNDLPSADGSEKTPKQLLEEENEKMLAAAQSGDVVMFTPSARTT